MGADYTKQLTSKEPIQPSTTPLQSNYAYFQLTSSFLDCEISNFDDGPHIPVVYPETNRSMDSILSVFEDEITVSKEDSFVFFCDDDESSDLLFQ